MRKKFLFLLVFFAFANVYAQFNNNIIVTVDDLVRNVSPYYYKTVTIKNGIIKNTKAEGPGYGGKYQLTDLTGSTIVVKTSKIPRIGENVNVTILIKPVDSNREIADFIEKDRSKVININYTIIALSFILLVAIIGIAILLLNSKKPQENNNSGPIGDNQNNNNNAYYKPTKDFTPQPQYNPTGDYYGKLVCEDGILKGEELFLTKSQITIKRDLFSKPDETISRSNHGIIYCQPNSLSIQAKQGKTIKLNGNIINNVPEQIKTGDEITLGTNLFKVFVG